MHDAITRYFDGEKLAGLVLIALGIVGFAGLAVLWRSSYRGALIPLGLMAVLQVAVGTGLYLRTDKQVAELRAQLDRSPAEYKSVEGQRMARVMRSFIIIEIVELTVLCIGIGLAFAFKQRETVFAVGLAVIAQGTIMLLFDLTAEARGRPYVAAIERLSS